MGIREDKQNSGTYIVRYFKRHPVTRAPRTLTRKGFRRMAEARRAHNELAIEMDRKFRETVVPTWSVALELFPEFCRLRDLQEKTISNYMVNLQAYTRECWVNRTVDSLTREEIRELVVTKTKDKSVSQQVNVLKFIKAVFNMCVDKGFLKHNPCPTIRVRRADKIKMVLTEHQTRAFLNQARAMGVVSSLGHGSLHGHTKR